MGKIKRELQMLVPKVVGERLVKHKGLLVVGRQKGRK
jgi:hypothetical protein